MTDILIDGNGNVVQSANGDLVVGDSVVQHQRDLLVSDKVHFRFAPLRGIGVDGYLLAGVSIPGLAGAIRSEFAIDELPVDNIQIKNGQVTINVK